MVLTTQIQEECLNITKYYSYHAVTEDEILQQIRKLEKEKAPGDDGYTHEFDKEFKELLTPLLQKASNFAQESGTASTWNSTITTVIHKDGNIKQIDPLIDQYHY